MGSPALLPLDKQLYISSAGPLQLTLNLSQGFLDLMSPVPMTQGWWLIKKQTWVINVAPLVEHTPSKQETLGSIPSTE